MRTRVSLLALGIAATLALEGQIRADEITLASAGGVAVPACTGFGTHCAGSLGFGPSLEIMMTSRVNQVVSWGFDARAARQHWQATFQSQIAGAPPATTDADLTSLFFGGGVRLTLASDGKIRPIALALVGLAMQEESGLALCGKRTGPWPTAVLGAGATRAISPSVGLFMLAAVSTGLAFGECVIADGPPHAPLAMWGLGLNLGVELGFHDPPQPPPAR